MFVLVSNGKFCQLSDFSVFQNIRQLFDLQHCVLLAKSMNL